MLVMAASNNIKHFVGIRKSTPDYARNLSPFTDDELRVAVPLMHIYQESLTTYEALMRTEKVGNLPRYIITSAKLNDRKKQTSNSISTLKQKEIKEILCDDGTAMENYDTLHGCIFSVQVSLERSDNNEGHDHSNEHHVSETQLDEYETNETEDIGDDNDTAIENVGYDGQCVPDYGRIAIGILSQSVLDQIVNLSGKCILSFWGVTSNGARSEMGRIVENLFEKGI